MPSGCSAKNSGDPIYLIDRTTERSYISMPGDYVPESLRPLSATMSRLVPSLFRPDGGLTIGPFPKGLPVNLLSNLQPLSESNSLIDKVRHAERMAKLLVDLKLYLISLPSDATDEQMAQAIGITATSVGGLSIGTNSWAREYHAGNAALTSINACGAGVSGSPIVSSMMLWPALMRRLLS